MACVITSVGLNGYNNDGLGRPSELFLYARVTGTCAPGSATPQPLSFWEKAVQGRH